MSSRNHPYKSPQDNAGEDRYASLKPTDHTVLDHLNEMTQTADGKTCTTSIPKIANACAISERQVQISTKRLIAAGLLKRIGYDFSNPIRAKRGTVYQVLIQKRDLDAKVSVIGKKKSIGFLFFWSED